MRFGRAAAGIMATVTSPPHAPARAAGQAAGRVESNLLAATIESIDAHLTAAVRGRGLPADLEAAILYVVEAGGKRLRPALVLLACEAVGGSRDDAMGPAIALELIHTFSLVHDDLPAMDDDTERRGRPTVHVAYGEDIAILAGDGLLTAAFESLATMGERAAAAVAVLAQRAGRLELLAGQARDLADDTPSTLAELEVIHAAKTGALFAAAAELGAIAAGDGASRDDMARFGMAIGVGFQHADDLDDGEFAELAEAARTRRLALAEDAAVIARARQAQALIDLAQWIGRS